MRQACIIIVIFGLVGAGCSEQSNKLPPSSGVGSTAAGLTAPQGPYPRGTVDPAHLPTRQGPEVRVVRPDRGAQTSLTSIDVELSVSDPDGVASVKVAGAPAAAIGGDRYAVTVNLAAGLNLLPLEATDALGDRSTGSFAVTQGVLLAPGELVPGAVQAHLGQPALDEAARRIEAATATLDLLAIVKNVTNGGRVLSNSFVTVDVTSITHAPPRVLVLTGATAGLTAAVALDNLAVELDVDLVGSGIVRVTADRARIDVEAAFRPATAAVPATGARLLGIDLDRVDSSFDNLRLTAASPVANTVLAPFKGLILNAIQSALDRALVRAAPNLLAKPIAGVDTPVEVRLPLLGGGQAPLHLLGRVEGGRGWANTALDLSVAYAVTAAAPVTTASVLVTRPTLSVLTSPRDEVVVALSSDAANAFAAAYWASGAGRYEVDGTQPSAAKLTPCAKVLYPFFPIVRDLAPDPNTPIVITATLEAPPVVRFAPGAVTLMLPEAQVSVALDYMDGGPRAELLRARLSLEASLRVTAQGTDLVLSDLAATQLGVDVIDEPSGDLDDQGVEDFIVAMLPDIVKKVTLPRIPVPALPAGIPLLSPTVDAIDGFVVVRATVR